MLDRQRSPFTRAVANGGHADGDDDDDLMNDDSIEEQLQTRANRTTIVPEPLSELDEPDLDEPDLSDPDLEVPTRIANDRPTAVVRSGAASSVELLRPPPIPTAASVMPKGNRSSPPSYAAPARSQLPVPRLPPPKRSPSQSLPAAIERLSQPPPATAERLSQPPPATAERLSQSPPATAERSEEYAKSDKWYLRVQLNTDCVADLWVRDLTPHNVLVWSNDMDTWVPLLTVRELRDAIRDAHEIKTREQLGEPNFVFASTPTDAAADNSLPKPLLPPSLVSAPPARLTNHWSSPKARTISNVPPPLLTTAVPVVSGVQPQVSQPPLSSLEQLALLARPQTVRSQPPPAPPRFGSQNSSLPPVVKTIGRASEPPPAAAAVPDIPRPARIPVVDDVLSHANAFQSPRDSRSPAHRVQARPTPQQPVAAAPPLGRARTAKQLIASLPLVHLERFLWLAAGVAVTSATMLLMRDASERPLAVRMGQAEAATTDVTRLSATAGSPSPQGDVIHRLEDLPLVAAKASWTPASTGASTASVAKGPKGKAKVSAAPVRLATAVNDIGPANPMPSAGAFDTAVARRVLTGSASRAGRCAAERSASGSVLVTFAPSGFVQSASISGLSGQGVNVGCVLRAFQEARISPFAGSPVTVRKSFQIL
jgi:hypothetical protein